MLPFVRPFWKLVLFSTLANLVFSAANALVLAIVEPVFRTLFGGEALAAAPAQAVPAAATGLKAQFDAFLSSLIETATYGESIRNISLLIFGLFVIRGLTKYIGNIISTRLEEGIMKRIRDTLFMHVTDQSVDFFSRRKAGDIISLLTNDVGVLNHATVNSVTTLWREASTLIIYLVLLLMISAKLMAISMGIALCGVLLIRTFTKMLRRYGARLQAAQADYTSTLQESILGIRVIKGMGVEPHIVDRFMSQTAGYVHRALRNTRVMGLIPVVNDTFGILALVSVFYVGGMERASGAITPSNLVTFLFLLFGLMQPISVLVNTIAGMQRGIAAGANVAAVLDEHPTITSGTRDASPLHPRIAIKNVSFSYGSGDVLRDVSFTIEHGETVALVGSSGSGKSTMLDLLLRFYDPTSGTVELDGVDVRTLDLRSYRHLFGVVSQETILFNDSVRNNISLGDARSDAERVRRVAEIAHADGFIAAMPEGYETVIGDRGVRLSGGQRQRIAIARALYREPQILLFDEATSALDTESERLVQEAIDDVLRDRTAVIVAHRLSTIVNADRIIVFDEGRIAEEGTHDALLTRGGVYARLHALQFANRA
jgi:subfamily B ATP-binding cassette protein MsbA